MAKKRTQVFNETKMLASRVEKEDYMKFEQLLRYRDRKSIQEFVNMVVVSYVSGSLFLENGKFKVK